MRNFSQLFLALFPKAIVATGKRGKGILLSRVMTTKMTVESIMCLKNFAMFQMKRVLSKQKVVTAKEVQTKELPLTLLRHLQLMIVKVT